MSRWRDRQAHVEQVIDAVSMRIDEETGRTFESTDSEERVFEAQRNGFVTVDDVIISTVTWNGSVVGSDEYSERRNRSLSAWALVDGPWYAGDEVTVTGTFGYSNSVPSDIWDLAVTWSMRVLKRADAGYQDSTAIPELGELVYRRAIPADVRRVLERYTRHSPVLRIS
jgi:hypothetical protein